MMGKSLANVFDFMRKYGIEVAKIKDIGNGVRIEGLDSGATVYVNAEIWGMDGNGIEEYVSVEKMMKILKSFGKQKVELYSDGEYLKIKSSKVIVDYINYSDESLEIPEFNINTKATAYLSKDEIRQITELSKVLYGDVVKFSTKDGVIKAIISGDLGDVEMELDGASEEDVKTLISWSMLKPLTKYKEWKVVFGNETPIMAEYQDEEAVLTVNVVIAPRIE